ncbi:hypothetical protein JX265_002061 [Neoarthrinium moseri]|uniref:Uncharacterized protein n=1 Tax=Neoarthrinium moseri TaxID=1658444 RepID=A0A9P9WWN4_9PEZI|nr:uncharacterized protein JN550_011570 [Neoarthrinium moseri]KAI1848057.1 hypothetical protein JX266_006170 [Neoarthrinium moseri]KAI1860304.1 hypothetical protein JN550_011570 [Neoarthrinium moseri]KAI1880440.1 hypothetical protein JX265_002061 [Neoarthrinium moseri]
MGITSGVGHFFQSIIEVIQGIFAAIFNAFALVLHTIADAGKGVVHFVEGTLGFAIHNFFILGTIAAGILGYLYYQQRQGSTTASRTLKNK